jgi:hypothetical protein
MNKLKMSYFFAASLGLAALLIGCQAQITSIFKTEVSEQQKGKEMFFSKKYSIWLGESGNDWAKRYPDKLNVDHQPAGIYFYKMDWERPRGIVVIEHGKYSFKIDDVLGVMGTYDPDNPHEGIFNIDVMSGLSVPDPGLGPHDEARLKTYAILERIQKAGWKILTPLSEPRLRGKERLHYALNDLGAYIGLDLTYKPSLEEWMRIENLTDWNFYADHQYLKVHFQRDSSFLDPTKPGAYLLSFELISETEEFRGYVESEFRKTYKEKLPNELAGLAKSRLEAETKLKAQGIQIDESYEDPPLPKGIKSLPIEQYVPNPKYLKPSPAAAPVRGIIPPPPIPWDAKSHVENSSTWPPELPPHNLSREEFAQFRKAVDEKLKATRSFPERSKTAEPLLAQIKPLKP